MSHFAVAVFTEEDQDLDVLMEPYDERLEVEQYVSMTKEDLIRSARERMQFCFENQYAEWMKDKEAYEAHSNPGHIEYLNNLPKSMDKTDEELYEEAISGYDAEDIDEGGGILSTYNPDSKWDWYEVGGRWQGMLLLKPGKLGERGNPGLMTEMTNNYDSALAADVDFEEMRRQLISQLTPYEHAIKNSFYKEEYMRQMFPTEEEYIQNNSAFTTYAVLTPDGEWHAPGDMGWFGMSTDEPDERRAWDDEYYERFIKPAIENNWRITIVDCHI